MVLLLFPSFLDYVCFLSCCLLLLHAPDLEGICPDWLSDWRASTNSSTSQPVVANLFLPGNKPLMWNVEMDDFIRTFASHYADNPFEESKSLGKEHL